VSIHAHKLYCPRLSQAKIRDDFDVMLSSFLGITVKTGERVCKIFRVNSTFNKRADKPIVA
jgi:hypothetical protein